MSCPSFASGLDSSQAVIRNDAPPFSVELNVPIYQWQRVDGTPPRAVLLFIHGTSLHGGVYDVLARLLASEGYIVFAPDMRGFGRWLSEPDTFPFGRKVSGFDSRADLIRLLCLIRRDYPNLPVYALGESLGANLALWVASVTPKLIDGVVMSGPCIKRRSTRQLICSTLVVDFLKFLVMPGRAVPLAPYARRYLSDSDDVVDAYINDPLMRKSATFLEALRSLHTNRSCLWFVDHIPASMPVLVFKGTNDRMMEQKCTTEFVQKLPIHDATVIELQGKGHIQLETPLVSSYVEGCLSNWLNTHVEKASGLISQAGHNDPARSN